MRLAARFAYIAAVLFALRLATYFVPVLRDATLETAWALALAVAPPRPGGPASAPPPADHSLANLPCARSPDSAPMRGPTQANRLQYTACSSA